MNRFQLPPRLLVDGFIESAMSFPDNAALEVDGTSYTYAQVAASAGALASQIQPQASSLVGVLGHKSKRAYCGLLASLLSGHGYVPLLPSHPIERTLRCVKIASLATIIVGPEALDCLRHLARRIATPMTFILPLVGGEELDALRRSCGQHFFRVVDETDHQPGPLARPSNISSDIAYLIFTSGSTGVPKGVAVRNSNATAFVDYMSERCESSPSDRFSQMADLTFDLSVFPVWVSWRNGSCLVCIADKDKLASATVVREKRITVWTSVPSTVVVLTRLRLLRPDSIPSIRYSFFCGEALPTESAKSWQAACPNSVVENMYGPTEATCALTGYRWTGDTSRSRNGVVPIGWHFEGHKAAVIDERFAPVASGVEGELCLSGPQVVDGYFKDPERTAQSFVRIEGLGDATWYRTGDLVEQASDGCYFFRGRVDHQVKVLGQRIELGEIEHVVKQSTRASEAVCLAWPVGDQAPTSLVVALTRDGLVQDEREVIRACADAMPAYMVPRIVFFLSAMPLSPNGKVDREELARVLQGLSV